MSHPATNTIEVVALSVVGWSSFVALVPMGDYLSIVGQIFGIIAALTTTVLGIRRIYLSFTDKRRKNDD